MEASMKRVGRGLRTACARADGEFAVRRAAFERLAAHTKPLAVIWRHDGDCETRACQPPGRCDCRPTVEVLDGAKAAAPLTADDGPAVVAQWRSPR
jgi:hypothetical protein